MLYLDFHHHIILVRCNESAVLQKLQEEFHFFVCPAREHSDFVIELSTGEAPIIPSLPATKILEHALVYRLGNLKYVDYFGEALAIQDDHLHSLKIYTTDTDRLLELGFLAVHSVVGKTLDEKGFHRIHAVAVTLNHRNALVMLPSKGGKSTLLENLLKDPDLKIISDDMPLIDWRGHLYPFPSKLGLNERPLEGPLAALTWHEFKRTHYPAKWTASLAQLKERIETNPTQNHSLLVAGFRLSRGESIMVKVPKWKMIRPLSEHMIVGIGLPQVIELFLNFTVTDLFKLPLFALKRSLAALALVVKADCYYFYMGPDKSGNARIILDLLYDKTHS